MNPTALGIIGILVLVAVIFTRMPVAYVMTLVGFVGFAIQVDWDAALKLLSRDFYDVYSSYGLTIIPLFIFMGQIAFNAGISRRLYDSAHKMVGRYRGGLATATICACTAFGAVCGSSPATAASRATVGLPEMEALRLRRRAGHRGSVAPPRLPGHAHASQRVAHRLRHPHTAVHRGPGSGPASGAGGVHHRVLRGVAVWSIACWPPSRARPCLRSPGATPASLVGPWTSCLCVPGGMLGLFVGWFTPHRGRRSRRGGGGAGGPAAAAA